MIKWEEKRENRAREEERGRHRCREKDVSADVVT